MLLYVLLAGAALLVLYRLGNSLDLSYRLREIKIGPDPDDYLATQEARIEHLIDGQQKQILWVNPEQKNRTPWAIVYLHGFSASNQEMAPVPQNVARALGANLYLTRLTGHGLQKNALQNLSTDQLLNDAHEAYLIGEKLGDRVLLIGKSTGATLASWMAKQDQYNRIAALSLLSPNYGPKHPMAGLVYFRWGDKILRWVMGDRCVQDARSEIHARYWSLDYPCAAILPMMALVKLTLQPKQLRPTQPVQIIYSPHDQVVDTKMIEAFFRSLPNKQKQIQKFLKSADPNQHVLAGDAISPESNKEVTERIISFVNSLPNDEKVPGSRH